MLSERHEPGRGSRQIERVRRQIDEAFDVPLTSREWLHALVAGLAYVSVALVLLVVWGGGRRARDHGLDVVAVSIAAAVLALIVSVWLARLFAKTRDRRAAPVGRAADEPTLAPRGAEKYPSFRGMRISMEGVGLEALDLDGADLSRVDLRQARLNRARLAGANLTGALLCRTHFDDAAMPEAKLAGADCREARFDRADLRSADLSAARLDAAVLQGALLDHASLNRTSLEGADLTRVSLREADLSDAVLREATIEQADVSGANLSGADLHGTRLRGLTSDEATRWPAGFERKDGDVDRG